MKYLKKFLILCGKMLGAIVGIYFILSAIVFSRSTYFLYPNIKEKYEIKNEIDTPEEAIEACRSNFGVTDPKTGQYFNPERHSIWDMRVRWAKEWPGKSDSYFQIKVIHDLNGVWEVKSTYEYSKQKECFNCFGLYIGPSTSSRCFVDAEGKKAGPNILGIFDTQVRFGH